MFLNDLKSLDVKWNEVRRKKTMIRQHLLSQICRVLVTKRIHIVNSILQIIFYPQKLCYLYTRQQKRCMQTCLKLQHLKQFNQLKTSFTDLSKIQSRCNNSGTSTCGLILTLNTREIIMYRVMSFLRHRTQSMKISLFYLPFPLLMHVYLPVIAVSAPSESKWPMGLNTFQILSSI